MKRAEYPSDDMALLSNAIDALPQSEAIQSIAAYRDSVIPKIHKYRPFSRIEPPPLDALDEAIRLVRAGANNQAKTLIATFINQFGRFVTEVPRHRR